MKSVLSACAAALALSGCATIFEGSSQPVTIKSVPDGASISVTNRAGEKIHVGQTPVTLTLKRGAGYFKSETYEVAIKKEGFEPKNLTITSSVNGWYIGNLLFGGLIGMLAVDPVTGAMYSFPDAVSATLDASAAKLSSGPGGLMIVSTERLSPQALSQARLLTALR